MWPCAAATAHLSLVCLHSAVSAADPPLNTGNRSRSQVQFVEAEGTACVAKGV